MGDNENIYSHEKYRLTREHLRQLQQLHRPQLQYPHRYLLLTQTGDEVLDYREGVDRYSDSQQVVIEGGEHGFSDFERYWPVMFEFSEEGWLAKQARQRLKHND